MKTGKLDFHSETGTEGGYFALQDSAHITYQQPNYGVFKGHSVYDPQDIFRRGKVDSSYREDGTAFEVGRIGDVSFLDILWNDGVTDIARASNTVLEERWGYKGLVLIGNGDRLTVFEKGIGSLALWSGEVLLEEQDPYEAGSFAPHGMACHHRPLNTAPADADEWSSWFFESRWATLERQE